MKKSRIVFILIIILMVILGLLGFVYAYITTDILKTPDQLFKKYLINSAVQISKVCAEPYGTVLESMKTRPIEITTKYNPNIENLLSSIVSDEDNENIEINMNIKSNIIMNLDLPNKNFSYQIDIKNNDKDYLNVNLVKSNDIMGIYIPEVHDKYLSVNTNLKQLAEKMKVEGEDLEKIPEKLPSFSFTQEQKDKLTEIFLKYGNQIFEQIDANLYTKEEYEIADFYGEQIKGNKYILTMPKAEFYNIFENLGNELLENQEFLNVIDGNILGTMISYIKESKKAASESDNVMSPSSIDYYNQENSILTNESEIENNDTTLLNQVEGNIQICLYEYKGENVKTEFIVENKSKFEYTINNKENSSYITISIKEEKDDFTKVGSEMIINFSNKYEKNEGEMLLSLLQVYNEDDVKQLKKEKEQNSFLADYYDDEYYEKNYGTNEASINIKNSFNNDVITSNVTYNMPKMQENFETTIKLNPKTNIPVLNSENAILVSDFSEEKDFEILLDDINKNMLKSAEENSESLIGSFMQSKLEKEKSKIENYKGFVYQEIKYAIDTNLEEYHQKIQNGENANVGDFLTVDKIQENIRTSYVDKLEIIDGNTMKCIIHDVMKDEYIFFVKIYIDGNELRLNELTVLYSEDGILENAV